ncbi:thiol reductant ABC exporter subunit CydD [Polycladidibacter stylochi]|uniref:thiol reductant ABC exporter subunit CydD n=1 Tax=Polycladidibacter stylochi TaxID=1807766 RepID=UPI00082DF5A8|nr:thiol reductant ABC exporter subunit CydD [Pseudovibrio stylochi]
MAELQNNSSTTQDARHKHQKKTNSTKTNITNVGNRPNETQVYTGKKMLAQLESIAKKSIQIAGAFSVASALLWLFQAAIVADQFAALIHSKPSLLPLLWAFIVFLALGAARSLLDFQSSGFAQQAGERVVAHIRKEVLAGEICRSPYDSQAPTTAALTSLLAEKAAMLHPYLLAYKPAHMRAMVMPLAILCCAFAFSWVVGVILLIAGPLIPLFMALVGYAAQATSEKQLKEVASLNTMLLERLRALTDIKVLGARESTIDAFERDAQSLQRRTMAVLRVAFLSSTVLELFAALGVAMTAVYVGFALLGELNFGAYGGPPSVFAGIFLLLLAPDFFQPLRDLATAWHDRANALAVAGELEEMAARAKQTMLGNGAHVPHTLENAKEASRNWFPLTVQNLCYETPAAKVIRYPDFTVHSSGSLAITGPSGSGKSTLLALLAGFMRPQAGTISLNGTLLQESNVDDWRRNLRWVPQHLHFQEISLRELLLVGQPEGVSDYQLWRALQQAHAKQVVRHLPEGLESRLGETGTGVSGGEARRLLLARAAVGTPAVILADEPTADLDEQTAQEIRQSLVSLATQGCCVIVATHDAAMASMMAQSIRLEGEHV